MKNRANSILDEASQEELTACIRLLALSVVQHRAADSFVPFRDSAVYLRPQGNDPEEADRPRAGLPRHRDDRAPGADRPETDAAREQESEVREDVPGVRDAEDGPLVGETVIRLVLRDRAVERQADERAEVRREGHACPRRA